MLIDTSLAIWLDSDPKRISRAAFGFLDDPKVECMLSVVSVWEMEIKHAIGRLQLSGSVETAVSALEERYSIVVIPLEREACHQLTKLPEIHGDPFDRMLACQALALGIPIVTSDSKLAQYPVQVIW